MGVTMEKETREDIIQHQKKVTKDVLKVINNNLDDLAKVAGGAPRDWVLGNPARDVDLYLRMNFSTQGKCKYVLKSILSENLDVEVKEVMITDVSQYGLGDIIHYILTFNIDGINFQFLVSADKSDNYITNTLERFSCNLSKITFNCHGIINKTKEFNKDIEQGTITFTVEKLSEKQKELFWSRYLPKMVKRFRDRVIKFEFGDED